MAQVKIWHYRDHHNGAKFDGNVYVNSNVALDAADLITPVRCRFRFAEFGMGVSVKSVWGVGNGDDAWSLKVYSTGGKYHLRIRFLDTDYDYTDLDLNTDEIYNVSIYLIATPAIVLDVRDRYNNPVYSETRASTSSGTLTTSNLFIGATSDSSGNPQQKFTGTLFDFWYYKSSTHRKLVFYKNYGGVGDATIKDFFGNRNAAVCGTIPIDFWSAKTDISGGITDISPLKHETDSYRTPVLTDMSFTWYGEQDIRINDTIGIEDPVSGKQNWFYRVYRTEEQDQGLMRIYCESIFTALDQVRSDSFLNSTNTFTTTRIDWWSNYSPEFFTGSNYDSTEYYYDAGVSSRRWITPIFIFKSVLHFLQYDNLLAVDVTQIANTLSDFSDSAYTLYYKWFAISHYSVRFAGRANKDDNDSADMSTLLRELLLVLRLTFFINDAVVTYRKVSYGTTAIANDESFDYRQNIETQRKFFQINQTRLATGTDYWDSWTSDDSEEISVSNISSSYKVRNSVIDVNLTDHFIIQRHGSTSNAIAEIVPSFLEQLANTMDCSFRRDIAYRNVKTGLTVDMNETYVRKIDDLVNQTSEIKQEV